MNPFFGYQSNRDVRALIGAYGLDELVHHGDRLLDIGCNQGHYCMAFADLVGQAVGVEPAAEIIGPAMKGAPKNVRFVQAPFKCSLIRGERFDVILMLAVLSHLEPPGLLARSLASALNPGGVLVFLTHTVACDPATEQKTDRFDLELRRFLAPERETLVDCTALESNDKQGKEGLHRRLIVYRNDQSVEHGGEWYGFHAAGGTSQLYRSGDRVLKWLDVEHERRELHERLPDLCRQEAAFLRDAEGLDIYPRLYAHGARHLVMEYRGEQPSPRTWPADWREQVEAMQAKLVAFGRPLGDVALENMLVHDGRLSLIDPIYIDGQHDPKHGDPARFAARVAELVKTDLNTKPVL